MRLRSHASEFAEQYTEDEESVSYLQIKHITALQWFVAQQFDKHVWLIDC